MCIYIYYIILFLLYIYIFISIHKPRSVVVFYRSEVGQRDPDADLGAEGGAGGAPHRDGHAASGEEFGAGLAAGRASCGYNICL